MWSLFSPRWTEWRTTLGLPPTPFLTATGAVRLPRRTPLLYGFSEAVVPVPGFWPSSVHTCGFWYWPHATAAEGAPFPRTYTQPRPAECLAPKGHADVACCSMMSRDAYYQSRNPATPQAACCGVHDK
jgi:hypothetical protein